jgi:16S rRNA C1402 (ribose-2'-O) methylase RsmI
MNKRNRRAHLESLSGETRTMIFYEAPHKLQATLGDLRDVFGPDRRLALCRELTKLHEQIVRATLSQAAEYYLNQTPRGEFVLVVEGAQPPLSEGPSPEEALERVEALCSEGFRCGTRCARLRPSARSRKGDSMTWPCATRNRIRARPLKAPPFRQRRLKTIPLFL